MVISRWTHLVRGREARAEVSASAAPYHTWSVTGSAAATPGELMESSWATQIQKQNLVPGAMENDQLEKERNSNIGYSNPVA